MTKLPEQLTDQQRAFLSMHIEDMGLSTRAQNCLVLGNRMHWGIEIMAHDELYLRKTPNMGPRSVAEVQQVVRDIGGFDPEKYMGSFSNLYRAHEQEIIDLGKDRPGMAALIKRIIPEGKPPQSTAKITEQKGTTMTTDITALTAQQWTFMKQHVDHMGLGVRVCNILKSQGITNGLDLLAQTEADLRKMPGNIKPTQVDEIKLVLGQNGFNPRTDMGITAQVVADNREKLARPGDRTLAIGEILSGSDKVNADTDSYLNIVRDGEGNANVKLSVAYPERYRGRLTKPFMKEAVDHAMPDWAPGSVHTCLKQYFSALTGNVRQNLHEPVGEGFHPTTNTIDPDHSYRMSLKVPAKIARNADDRALTEVFSSEMFHQIAAGMVETSLDKAVKDMFKQTPTAPVLNGG